MNPVNNQPVNPPANPVVAPIEQMDDTIAYMRARMRGFNPQAHLQEVMRERREALAANMHNVVTVLTEEREETMQDFAEVVEMMTEVDPIAPAREQATEIGQNVITGAERCERLTSSLLSAQQELEMKKMERAAAVKALQEYMRTLQLPSAEMATGTIYQLGQQACKNAGERSQK